jgi:hypothetical protein
VSYNTRLIAGCLLVLATESFADRSVVTSASGEHKPVGRKLWQRLLVPAASALQNLIAVGS